MEIATRFKRGLGALAWNGLVRFEGLYAPFEISSNVFGVGRVRERDGCADRDANVSGAGPVFVRVAQIEEAVKPHRNYRNAQAIDEQSDSCAERSDCAIGRELASGKISTLQPRSTSSPANAKLLRNPARIGSGNT